MDRLTKEEIVAAWNGAVSESKDKGIEMYLHLIQAVADAQYRKCVQSLSQEAVRDEALEEAAQMAQDRAASDHDDFNEFAQIIRALKREPNAEE